MNKIWGYHHHHQVGQKTPAWPYEGLSSLSDTGCTVSSQHVFDVSGLLQKMAWADGRWHQASVPARILVNSPRNHLLKGIQQ